MKWQDKHTNTCVDKLRSVVPCILHDRVHLPQNRELECVYFVQHRGRGWLVTPGGLALRAVFQGNIRKEEAAVTCVRTHYLIIRKQLSMCTLLAVTLTIGKLLALFLSLTPVESFAAFSQQRENPWSWLSTGLFIGFMVEIGPKLNQFLLRVVSSLVISWPRPVQGSTLCLSDPPKEVVTCFSYVAHLNGGSCIEALSIHP